MSPAVSGSTAGGAASAAPPQGADAARSAAPTAAGPSGRELVDRHTHGNKTDVDAVAADLRDEIQRRPREATTLTLQAMEHMKADDRDELAQEFVRAHSDSELKALGQSDAGKGALALAVNELTKGKVHQDEADDARRVGQALGVEVDVKVNAGWSWERVSGAVHTVLDVAGFIPGLGAVPDLINAGIYAAEGDWKNAALSGVAAVPLVGDGAKATSMAVKGGRELLEAGAKQTLKHGDEALDAGRAAAKVGDDAAAAAARQGSHAPNATVSHNGYTYKTDAQGRVSDVKGELTLNKAQGRNGRAQREAGGADRLADDQGGHLIGRRFDGPTEEINHFAQNGNFNMGAYRSLENKWDKLLQEGHNVRVEVKPSYSADSLRPDALKVQYWVDGVPQDAIRFKNVAGGR